MYYIKRETIINGKSQRVATGHYAADLSQVENRIAGLANEAAQNATKLRVSVRPIVCNW